MPKLQGQCYCGAVRFQIPTPLNLVGNCHCMSCQRAHGAPFATNATLRTEQLEILSGEQFIKTVKYIYRDNHERAPADSGRHFCSECGSRLFNNWPDAPLVSVWLSNIEDLPEITPMNVNVATKRPWVFLADDAEQYETFPFDLPARLKSIIDDVG